MTSYQFIPSLVNNWKRYIDWTSILGNKNITKKRKYSARHLFLFWNKYRHRGVWIKAPAPPLLKLLLKFTWACRSFWCGPLMSRCGRSRSFCQSWRRPQPHHRTSRTGCAAPKDICRLRKGISHCELWDQSSNLLNEKKWEMQKNISLVITRSFFDVLMNMMSNKNRLLISIDRAVYFDLTLIMAVVTYKS